MISRLHRPALLGLALWLAWPLAAGAQTASPAAVPVAGQLTLPHDLSPWGMFMGADLVVKGVLIGLVFASIVTWTVALAKLAEIWLARRRARRALHTLLSATDTMQAASALERQRGVIPELISAATEEVRRSGAQSGADGIKERIAMRFQRMEAGEARRILAGTGVLATIGATAPFVGLFGTVWGIMNSFIGISKSQTTNLAVVAPGIAEALLATAIGLVAAIPAVVAYNIISRASAGYRSLVADAAAEILRTVSRDLDRHKAASSEASSRGATAMAAE